jgi:hypothetical protein
MLDFDTPLMARCAPPPSFCKWRFEGANWDSMCAVYTHLIIFSLEPAADGRIAALDRMPRPMLLEEARAAATRHGTKLLICFGGNGRSGGYGTMVRSPKARRRFVDELLLLCSTHGFHGVDYNWEYPGFAFGKGYASDSVVAVEYRGLAALVRETRAALDDASNPSTADTVRRCAALACRGKNSWFVPGPASLTRLFPTPCPCHSR